MRASFTAPVDSGVTDHPPGRRWRNPSRIPLTFALLLILAGCATHGENVASVRGAFYSGDTAGARTTLLQLTASRSRDRDVLVLDQAIVELFSGNPRTAEQLMREVRDRFDYFEQMDVREQLLALLTDDRAISYAGDDHEKVLLRLMLAFSDLADDGDDALAYAYQTIEKQQQLMDTPPPGMSDNPRKKYRQVAAAAYLFATLREATYTDYDDAARWYSRVVEWAPRFRQGHKDLERAREGVFAAPGHGVLYVFGFVDRGPYKVEAVEVPTTVSLQIASSLLSALGEYTVPPNIAPVKVPQVVAPPRSVSKVQISTEAGATAVCQTLSDINAMAVQQAEALKPWIVARAVARRILKKATVVGVKDALDAKDPLVQIAFDAAGVVWEATERADTRCWSLLPGRIQAARLELQAGQHRVRLQAFDNSGAPGRPVDVRVTLAPGKATFLLAYFPSRSAVGKVLVSPPY